jgi:uncharacterized membrane protein YgcG
MNHEHPPEENHVERQYSEKEMELLQEHAEAVEHHNSLPDPKDPEAVARVAELRRQLAERNIDPEKLPEEKPKTHDAHADHGHDHGHGEEAKKPLWKRFLGGAVGTTAVGGGLFTGLLSMFMKNVVNTIMDKDGGGGGGGHKSGGGHGGGHGGGGHH